mmetsp:Transcript_21043/g.36043  ORF Transcript_21043/g.36043 Transcript_21043/m.36043 type:complete len:235 (+) Transcript_21043:164-868(+)
MPHGRRGATRTWGTPTRTMTMTTTTTTTMTTIMIMTRTSRMIRMTHMVRTTTNTSTTLRTTNKSTTLTTTNKSATLTIPNTSMTITIPNMSTTLVTMTTIPTRSPMKPTRSTSSRMKMRACMRPPPGPALRPNSFGSSRFRNLTSRRGRRTSTTSRMRSGAHSLSHLSLRMGPTRKMCAPSAGPITSSSSTRRMATRWPSVASAGSCTSTPCPLALIRTRRRTASTGSSPRSPP